MWSDLDEGRGGLHLGAPWRAACRGMTYVGRDGFLTPPALQKGGFLSPPRSFSNPKAAITELLPARSLVSRKGSQRSRASVKTRLQGSWLPALGKVLPTTRSQPGPDPAPGRGGRGGRGLGNLAGTLFRSPPSTVTAMGTAGGNEEERGQGRQTLPTKRAHQVQWGQEAHTV